MIKKEAWRGQNSAKFIYFRYKDSPYFSLLMLSIILIVCFLLVTTVIIPQAQKWLSIRDEETATRQRLANIRNNIAFMSALNKQANDDNMKLAVRALPVEKDFGAIINAVAIAAVQSGVSVDDFSFSLGLVSSGSGAKKSQGEMNENMTSSITLSLEGGIDKMKTFITKIGEKLPISEIESVNFDNNGTYLSLFFHSKPYAAPRVSEDESINALSAENNSLFGKLAAWDEISSYDDNLLTPASSAAIPLF